MNRANSLQQDSGNLETALLIALVRMKEQYGHWDDDPFWANWDKQEELYYRSSEPHLTMPQPLRDEAIKALSRYEFHELFDEPAPGLMALGLTTRQAALTGALVKLCFIYLTRTDAKIGADAPDDTMDNVCMSAGENAYGVLARLGLIEIDVVRFANWTEQGREVVRSLKDDITLIIKSNYDNAINFERRPRLSEFERAQHRSSALRFYEEKMKLWLFT